MPSTKIETLDNGWIIRRYEGVSRYKTKAGIRESKKVEYTAYKHIRGEKCVVYLGKEYDREKARKTIRAWLANNRRAPKELRRKSKDPPGPKPKSKPKAKPPACGCENLAKIVREEMDVIHAVIAELAARLRVPVPDIDNTARRPARLAVLGFRLCRKADGSWYALRRCNGAKHAVYIARTATVDAALAEEKIRAYCDARGIEIPLK